MFGFYEIVFKMIVLKFDNQEIKREIRPLGFWEKMIGLGGGIFGEAVYFQTRFGIHTFGLSEPIDVLVLGERGEVGAIFRNLVPGQARFWNPKFRHVFEFSGGALDKITNPQDGKFVWYYEMDGK
jgi:hypothetical protein